MENEDWEQIVMNELLESSAHRIAVRLALGALLSKSPSALEVLQRTSAAASRLQAEFPSAQTEPDPRVPIVLRTLEEWIQSSAKQRDGHEAAAAASAISEELLSKLRRRR